MKTVVETSAGRIRGREEGDVCVFRGVPYAAPPVAAGRFRPPGAVVPWAGTRDALVSGPSAPQAGGMAARMLGMESGPTDEDCLTLDVFAPSGAGRRPVMVWIHGGSFTVGAGAQAVYDGSRLARRGDVVVVSIHYRLGALGWLALPGLANEEGGCLGNAGLLDQMAALRFVRENAEAFGGDPGNVTVFGESAGAMSIGAMLASPGARGLFDRAILQSGAAENAAPAKDAIAVGERFMKALGLASDDHAGLRAAPVEALLAAQTEVLNVRGLAHRGLPFQPTVDGSVLPTSPTAALATGEAAAVPLLLGTNLDEWKFFGLVDPKARELDDAALLRRCVRTIPGGGAEGGHAARVIDAYRRAREGRAASAPSDLWFAIETDRYFRLPALRLAESQQRRGLPVWKYLFTWASPAFDGAVGSCHALEVPFVFGLDGDAVLRGLVGDGPAARTLSEQMQDAWLTFARSGRPAAPGLPEWPSYETGTRATMQLGAASDLVLDPLGAERMAWDGLL